MSELMLPVTEPGADGLSLLRFPEPFNVAEFMIDRHVTDGRGGKAAIRTVDGDVTYAELLANVNRFGNALQALGIGRGERVLLAIRDCPEFFYLFWGAIKANVIPVPLNTLLRADDFAFIIRDSQCAGVIYSSEFAHEVEAAVARSPWRPPHVLPLDGGADAIGALARSSSSCLQAVPVGAGADCFWLYSSGTTGRPKGVVHVHRDIAVSCQRFVVETLGACETDVFYSVPRLYFAYGLGCGMTNPLWVGATTILDHRRPTPQLVTELFRRFAPTIFAGVPTFYAALLSAHTLAREDAAHLRRCLSGGEATPPELHRRWLELTGLPILEVIGSTEALHIYIGNRSDDFRVGTLGKPVPGYRVRLVDEHGRAVPDRTPGRVWINGQSLARCYWNDPERTARTFVDGWMDTSDIMLRDQDGYYVYCGRADDMLKVSGRFVSPFEIESTLVEDPRVLEAAVVGRPDADGLIRVEAWVVLKEPGTMTDTIAEEIRALCKSKLAPYKYPTWINVVDQLPKTATGKVQRFKLRHRMLGVQ